ncbi:MAG: hypothetical protein KDD04_01365 [Sinomicrobium sp.]|nr:hypothetical protein [Sinomicrobium sp.]
MNLIITTPEDLRLLVQEALANNAPQAPEGPGLMKLGTAAKHFDISVRSLRRMAAAGEITLYQRSKKQGSECRVDPVQVRKALTKNEG